MPDKNWTYVIEESELIPETPFAVFPKGLSALLIKKGEMIYALDNRCPHMSCPLTKGKLEEYILHCPCHGWRFDIRTGEFIDAREIAVPSYEWMSENGKIYLKLGV